MPDGISVRDAKRLAGYLHTANSLTVSVRRGEMPADTLVKASELIKRVVGELMDLPGQTDFYGNPTYTGWKVSK